MKNQFVMLASKKTGKTREDRFMDRDYLVVPVVALVEGVIHPSNAPAPELALAEEFAKVPAGWNGRPFVMNHPEIDGQKVSANSPAVLEAYQIGFLFNTELRDKTSLVTEAWIDIDRCKALEGKALEIYNDLVGGKTYEVSTGLFAQVDDVAGRWNSESYTGKWTEVVPDHLAILTDGAIGACSIADGCGALRDDAAVVESDDDDEPEDLKRVETAAKALATLALNAAKQPAVKANCGCEDTKACKCGRAVTLKAKKPDVTTNKGFMKLMEAAKNLLLKSNKLRDNSDAISDSDLRTAIMTALDLESDAIKDNDPYAWNWTYIVAVFDSNFVYFDSREDGLTKRDYVINKNLTVSLGDNKSLVNPVTQFVEVDTSLKQPPLAANAEGKMDKAALVASIIASTANEFTAEDTEMLMGMEEATLGKVLGKADAMARSTPVKKAAGDDESAVQTDQDEDLPNRTKDTDTAKANATDAATKAKSKQDKTDAKGDKEDEPGMSKGGKANVTAAEYIADAPAEIREVLANGVELHNQRKNTLIDNIKKTGRCDFSDDYLKGLSIKDLEATAKLAGAPTVDYSGRVVPQKQTPIDSAAADGDRTGIAPKPISIMERKSNVTSRGMAKRGVDYSRQDTDATA